MPKAAPKLAAAPSTPPARNSKVPLEFIHFYNFFAAPTVTVPDCGGPTQREAEKNTVDTWPQLTEFRSWKISFKTKVSQSSQYPRDAVLWIGEVEDAETIDDFIASASTTKINIGLRES